MIKITLPDKSVKEFDSEIDGVGIAKSISNSLAKSAVCMDCLLYTSPSPRDGCRSRMPSSA